MPVRGADPRWRRVGWDTNGGLFFLFRDAAKDVPQLLRLQLASGRVETIADLAPRDRAGIEGLGGVVVASDGQSWAFNVRRRLSDLHVVTHLQ